MYRQFGNTGYRNGFASLGHKVPPSLNRVSSMRW
jgi:hypothetical protein